VEEKRGAKRARMSGKVVVDLRKGGNGTEGRCTGDEVAFRTTSRRIIGKKKLGVKRNGSDIRKEEGKKPRRG